MENSHILPIHKRLDVFFTYGKGVHIYDSKNRQYLDFGAGIAVNSLGHCHPKLVKALKAQAGKLWHVSNAYRIKELEDLADILSKNTFADYAFFCNSGAEAIECVIKMVRKYFYAKQQAEKYEIITFKGSFHGRTLATISASNNEKFLEGFEPRLPGFKSAIFNDIKSVENLISKNTAAILIEPIQGEGGIIPADKQFMKDLRQLADKNNLLLALDEVQCGAGRTGYFYAYEYYNIKPDIIASAKGIGGGFPVGICLATKEAASGMGIGSHGTTFGGNPLAMKVTNAAVEIILKKGFLNKVTKSGNLLFSELNKLKKEFPHIIKEVRGIGLMIGFELEEKYNNLHFVELMKDYGFLGIAASKNTIRLVPPLIITSQDVKKAIYILRSILQTLK